MAPKLFRTKLVTIRINPQLHYLAVLSARAECRTLSNFIESIMDDRVSEQPTVPPRLWHVDAEERLIRLARLRPDLLSYDEQIRWANHPANKLERGDDAKA